MLGVSKMTLGAWSPNGFRFFCMSVAISVLTVETIKSIVDLVPGTLVNFVVYNTYGFICFNLCLYFGRKIYSMKSMWFINGFLCSSVFMLWYASRFDMGENDVLPAVYGVELVVTLLVSNCVRRYEHPKHYEDLAKFRSDVIPVSVVSKHSEIEMKDMSHFECV
jgi:hypothetical protein